MSKHSRNREARRLAAIAARHARRRNRMAPSGKSPYALKVKAGRTENSPLVQVVTVSPKPPSPSDRPRPETPAAYRLRWPWGY